MVVKLNRFWFGLAVLWLFALTLRLWNLERFNTLVFDEIYFAKFGNNYLTHTPFFDAHPPLGKYMIALGIWLKGFNPWGFRWMNALVGSWIPLVLAGIADQITRRRSYALIAGGLATLDGLLLVESRYALLNVYLLLFGLLGHWFCLLAANQRGIWRWGWLTLSAIAFGACVAVKWNGLGFLLGLYLFWSTGWIVSRLFLEQQSSQMPLQFSPLQRLLQLSPVQLFVYLPAIALLVYSLIWIPHLQQNPTYDFWQVHQEILAYHQRVGSGKDVHPYCSRWYTWPFLLRPISYFYQTAVQLSEPIPITGPPLPNNAVRHVYSIYATGNPPLWWLSTTAILFIMGRWCWEQWNRFILRDHSLSLWRGKVAIASEQLWVPLYLSSNYAANFLPWAGVSRCTFLYHYMGAALFGGLALAWLVDQWLRTPQQTFQWMGLTILSVSVLGFVFLVPFLLRAAPISRSMATTYLVSHPGSRVSSLTRR